MTHSYDQDLMLLLAEPVDVKKLVDRLQFSMDTLELAAMEQPKLYLRAGRFRAQSILRMSKLRRRLQSISGEKSLKIRQKRSGLTETAIKGRLTLDPEVSHAQRKYDEAEVLDEFAKQLSEAYKERLMAIGMLVKLTASEISSELRSVKGKAAVEMMDKRMEHLRKRLPEMEEEDD